MDSPRLLRLPFDTKFNVKVLVIVNSSPWGGSLGATGLRLVRAMLQHGPKFGPKFGPEPGPQQGPQQGGASGLHVAAVFFRGEGVYQALAGRVSDSGTPALRDAWLELMRQYDLPLLLCSAAAQRQLEACPRGGFREAGLAEVLDLMDGCDRVVTF
jgi:sulfur relay (sulfurtransferase) DsrF/TusC family protein